MGNSLSDYYTDKGMAAIGYGVMAVTGAVAAQFFNFTIGWSVSLLRPVLSKGSVEFDLFGLHSGKMTNTALYACAICLISAIHMITFIFVPCLTEYRLTNKTAIYLFFVYAGYVSSMVGLMLFLSYSK